MRVSAWRDDMVPRGWTGSENTPTFWMPLPVPPNGLDVKSKDLAAAE
jgi:hypothetical protein